MELEHWSFPTFGFRLKHGLFLGLKVLGFRLELTPSVHLVLRPLDSAWKYTTSSLQSPACQLKFLGLYNLHNEVSQFLIINILSVLFLWRTLTNTHKPIYIKNNWITLCKHKYIHFRYWITLAYNEFKFNMNWSSKKILAKENF